MAKTFCLQIAVHPKLEGDFAEKWEHMINCKPLIWDSDKEIFVCSCGKYQKYRIDVSEILDLIKDEILNNKVKIRID